MRWRYDERNQPNPWKIIRFWKLGTSVLALDICGLRCDLLKSTYKYDNPPNIAAIWPDGCSFVCQHLHVRETALVPWILEGMRGLRQWTSKWQGPRGPPWPQWKQELWNASFRHFWGFLPKWSVLSQNLPQFRRHPGPKSVKGHDMNLPWYDYFLAWYAFVGKRWPPKKRSYKFFRWPSTFLLFGTFLCYIILPPWSATCVLFYVCCVAMLAASLCKPNPCLIKVSDLAQTLPQKLWDAKGCLFQWLLLPLKKTLPSLHWLYYEFRTKSLRLRSQQEVFQGENGEQMSMSSNCHMPQSTSVKKQCHDRGRTDALASFFTKDGTRPIP